MSNELKELMQISVIGENKDLSNMIEDIMPVKEQRFTDLELSAEKKETFVCCFHSNSGVGSCRNVWIWLL